MNKLRNELQFYFSISFFSYVSSNELLRPKSGIEIELFCCYGYYLLLLLFLFFFPTKQELKKLIDL